MKEYPIDQFPLQQNLINNANGEIYWYDQVRLP